MPDTQLIFGAIVLHNLSENQPYFEVPPPLYLDDA